MNTSAGVRLSRALCENPRTVKYDEKVIDLDIETGQDYISNEYLHVREDD